ncbi:MAG: ABC transporter substrate-binding protein [Alphaproteobacteria bacterium]
MARFRGFVFVLLAACAFAAAASAQEQPVRGDTLVFGINSGDPPTYDCHQSVLFPIIHLLTPHYSNLLKIDTEHYPKIVGDLAESWTVSPDAKTYTFKLHVNVKFHDGSPFSSEDIKATYDRIRNPPQGVVSVRRGLVADIDTIETPDPLTVVFNLKEGNRALVYAFANPFNCVYSAAKLKENPLYPVRNVMGTGPFRFVEHVGGSHWVGERFKDYFKPGLPYLDGFRAQFTQGPALINALQGGQVMADFRSVTTADRDRLTAALGDKITVHESPWLNVLLVTFNTRKPPFNDARVRRALSLAIDRWRASEVLPRSSIMRYVGAYLRPGSEFAAREEDLVKMPGFGKDIEASRKEARRLLAEAGVPNLKVRLINRTISNLFTPAGIYVIDQWRQIGVETEHVQANDTLYNNSMNEGTFDVALDFQGDSVDEPTYQLARHLSVDLSSNRGKYTDRAIDELFDRQKDLTDPKERYAAVRAFEQRMLDEAYTVPLLWWQRIVVMRSNVKGWYMTPSHLIGQDLETVWLKP